MEDLEQGMVRAASQNSNGDWQLHPEVKTAILKKFSEGSIREKEGFFDKDTVFPRRFHLQDSVRLVPGGSAVRKGSYVAPGVVIMPPSYINIGAYVDRESMIDSHVLIGSCAQIGKRVHISAGVQIGGVLEPIGLEPVIVEDDAFIGAGAVIVEGIRVGKSVVIAPSTVLSRSVSIYDMVHKSVLPKGSPVPANAVVVPGMRPIESNEWAKDCGLGLACPIIVKYRDEKTDASLEIEGFLRG